MSLAFGTRRGARAGRRPGPTRAPAPGAVLAGRSTRSAPGRRTARRAPSAPRGRAGTASRRRSPARRRSSSTAARRTRTCARGSSNASSASPELRPRLVRVEHRESGAPRRRLGRRLPGEGGRFTGCQALGHVPLHRAHPLEVAGRVQPQPARRPLGPQEAVAAFPRTQELRAHARAATELADPQVGVIGHVRNDTRSVQDLDRFRAMRYRACRLAWTKPIQEVNRHEDARRDRRHAADRRRPQLGPRRARRVRPRRLDLRRGVRHHQRRQPDRLRPRRRWPRSTPSPRCSAAGSSTAHHPATSH